MWYYTLYQAYATKIYNPAHHEMKRHCLTQRLSTTKNLNCTRKSKKKETIIILSRIRVPTKSWAPTRKKATMRQCLPRCIRTWHNAVPHIVRVLSQNQPMCSMPQEQAGLFITLYVRAICHADNVSSPNFSKDKQLLTSCCDERNPRGAKEHIMYRSIQGLFSSGDVILVAQTINEGVLREHWV